jgi:hypothetical protein
MRRGVASVPARIVNIQCTRWLQPALMSEARPSMLDVERHRRRRAGRSRSSGVGAQPSLRPPWLKTERCPLVSACVAMAKVGTPPEHTCVCPEFSSRKWRLATSAVTVKP